MITQFIFIFVINALSNCLGTLKTIFISKNAKAPVYIVTAIDALVFAFVVKSISSGNDAITIIAYVLGKVVGVYIGQVIDKKLGLGILDISVYAKEEKAKNLADKLREVGYSVTTQKGYGYNGSPRYIVNITIARKEMDFLVELLKKYGYNKATMIVKEVKSVNGKVKIHKKDEFSQ
jgi:uncharacterized protein YebE (UPF0316 family)